METVTVLAPVYNEEAAVAPLFNTFIKVLESNGYYPKFLIVNDASCDKTLDKLLAIKKTLPYPITIVSLKYRVGQHAALIAGLNQVTQTDYVLITDVDLQNPPQLAIPLLRKLKEKKCNIVYGLRSENRLGNGLFSKLFWIVVSFISKGTIPPDQTPLKVLDRTFIRNFKKMPYRYANFMQAVLADVAAKKAFYPVATLPRTLGSSKYNVLNMVKLCFVAICVILFGAKKSKNYVIAHIYK